MKCVVLGASEFALKCADGVIAADAELASLISMPEYLRPNNSVDVASFADEHGVPYHEVDDINSPISVDLIQSCSPDYIVSTWPKMLHKEVLEAPAHYCIGTHPTALPYNRGRHPLHWLIALGVKTSSLSFFRMDEGSDTGDILLQVPVELNGNDTIASLTEKVNEAAYTGTKELLQRLLLQPQYFGSEQEHGLANTWRKRTQHDVTLDLRMSTDGILRTIRSFAPPFPCANLVFRSHVLRIRAGSIVNNAEGTTAADIQRLEPGRIIFAKENRIQVKVDDGIVELECTEPVPSQLGKAKYIHPPSAYFAKYPAVGEIFRSTAVPQAIGISKVV